MDSSDVIQTFQIPNSVDWDSDNYFDDEEEEEIIEKNNTNQVIFGKEKCAITSNTEGDKIVTLSIYDDYNHKKINDKKSKLFYFSENILSSQEQIILHTLYNFNITSLDAKTKRYSEYYLMEILLCHFNIKLLTIFKKNLFLRIPWGSINKNKKNIITYILKTYDFNNFLIRYNNINKNIEESLFSETSNNIILYCNGILFYLKKYIIVLLDIYPYFIKNIPTPLYLNKSNIRIKVFNNICSSNNIYFGIESIREVHDLLMINEREIFNNNIINKCSEHLSLLIKNLIVLNIYINTNNAENKYYTFDDKINIEKQVEISFYFIIFLINYIFKNKFKSDYKEKIIIIKIKKFLSQDQYKDILETVFSNNFIFGLTLFLEKEVCKINFNPKKFLNTFIQFA